MITSVAIMNQHFRDINPKVCGCENCDPGHKFGPAVRNYWLVHYVMSGEGIFRTPAGEYHLHASQIFVIRPGELTDYEADRENPWQYIWIGFESGVSMPPILQKDVITLPQGRALFESLPEAKNMAAGKEAYLCGKIWELLYMLSEARRQEGRKEIYIRQAKNYIETEYMTGITVGGLASRLGLDRSYFSSLFRRQEGKSPQRYLNEVRMREAAIQLMKQKYTVTETAASVGYSDVFAFSRMFKQYYGISPSCYRSGCINQEKVVK